MSSVYQLFALSTAAVITIIIIFSMLVLVYEVLAHKPSHWPLIVLMPDGLF